MAIRYIVNEDKRVVVALLENCSRDAINTANAWTGYYNNNACSGRIDLCVHYANKYLMPDKFSGVAFCSIQDEWNEETGKKIARERVLDKYHRSLNKAIRKINKDIQAEANRFNVRVQKLRDTK